MQASFSTPETSEEQMATPQKKSALNALEMLSKPNNIPNPNHHPPIFPPYNNDDVTRKINLHGSTSVVEEPSPARLEGANALALLLLNPLSKTAKQSLMSIITEEENSEENSGKKTKTKKRKFDTANTPSVPKVRRFSQSKKPLSYNEEEYLLSQRMLLLKTPMNRKSTKGKISVKKQKISKKRKTPKTENVSNRKEKALGLLCLRFVQEFEKRGNANGDVFLDEAGIKLGVERRRIYDIVNILEALDIVSRKAKNLYTWHGIRTYD